MNKIIFVTSGKGGTGKSFFALNLGATLALNGHKSLVVDMNTGMRTLDLMMGVENKALYDFSDIVNKVCDAKDAVIKCDTVEGLDIIVSTQRAGEFYREDTIKRVLGQLAADYDYIILDGGPGIDMRTDICAKVANETVIVLTPDNMSIRAAEAVDARLITGKIIKRRCVVNRVDPEMASNDVEPSVSEIDQRIGAELIGMIPEDSNIRISCGMGIPAVLMQESYVAESFRRIANRIMTK